MSGPTLRLAGRRRARRAFTLVELLVSLAVIGAVLVAVGIVFTGTTQTATHAAALTETQNWLRQAAEELQADLAAADRTLPLVLAGRTQAAALTEAERQAGRFYRVPVGDPTTVASSFDPADEAPSGANSNADYARFATLTGYSAPRADVISFFTLRRKAAQAPAPQPRVYVPASINDEPYLSPQAQWGPVHVAYGHAAVADGFGAGAGNDVTPASLRHIENAGTANQRLELSPLPLTDWVLARRALIIRQNRLNDVDFAAQSGAWNTDRPQRLLGCVAGGEYPGDVAGLNLELLRYLFGPSALSSGQGGGLGVARPYEFPTGTGWAQTGDPALPPGIVRNPNLVWDLLYPGGSADVHHLATVVREPPLEYAGNLSLQPLPGCVWFQVEFLMPEDPRNSPEYDTPDPTDTDIARRHDPVRWTEVVPGQTYVFVPDTEENRRLVLTTPQPANQRYSAGTGEFDFARLNPLLPAPAVPLASNRIVRMWPYAGRITLRAIDPARRLDAPLERTIVHRFE